MTYIRRRVVVDNGTPRAVIKMVVHRFLVADCEDPDLYAAQPIWEWQQTEQGSWVMEHAVKKPSYHQQMDMSSMSYMFAIVAELYEEDATYFKLKWT